MSTGVSLTPVRLTGYYYLLEVSIIDSLIALEEVFLHITDQATANTAPAAVIEEDTSLEKESITVVSSED